MHPAAPCCSALAYALYACFSRLARRAPLSSRCVTLSTNRTTKATSIIRSHFGRRRLPSDGRCEHTEYVDSTAFSHLANLEVSTCSITNLFFLEPLASGKPPSTDAVGTSPQILKIPIQPVIPYASPVFKRYLMVPTRKCLGCSTFERAERKTTSSLIAKRLY